MPTETAALPAPATSKVTSTGSASTAATPPGNMSFGALTTMLQKPRDAAKENSSRTEHTKTTPEPASSEHAPVKGKGKTAKAATTTETAVPVTELGAATETPETPAEEIQPDATAETEDETQPAEELGAEESAEPAGETKALPDEVQATLDDLKAGGRNTEAKMLKRIHKLADARDTERIGRLQAEQRAQQAEARAQQLQTAPKGAMPGPGADRYAAHPDVRTLDEQIAAAEQVLNWADANPDGAELEGKQFTPEQLRRFQRQAESNLSRLNGERAARVTALQQESTQNRQRFNGEARKLYPWINNRNSAEYAEATRLVQAAPWIMEMPGAEMIVGRYIAGLRAEQARSAAPAAKPAKTAPRTPPPVATASGAAAPRAEPGDKKKVEAESAFAKTGRVGDLAKMFANNKTAKQAA